MPAYVTIGTCNGIYLEEFHAPHIKFAVDIFINSDPVLLKSYVIPVGISETECEFAEEQQPVLICTLLTCLFLQFSTRSCQGSGRRCLSHGQINR
eukprot:CAMPEP_0172663494 /NCGR_PEP_ID=MMETSP1074-20121228/5962_1 /TAXON_ID=2916 /ORGANISM="Ceratium fusus, Strain PA161109" /LENGTH=94 /DNA_ID=CAMNT_0013479501 /DNA_START=270 /DNA_END=554 /DNA_ORIENTATION=-